MDTNVCQKVGCGSYTCPEDRQITNLLDDLHCNKIREAEINLMDKFNSIKNNLNKNFSDDNSWLISSYSDFNDYEHALNQIDSKINTVNSHINDINNEINNIEEEKNKTIKKLKNEHQEKVDELNNVFDLDKKKFSNLDEEKEVKNIIEKLKKTKEQLQNNLKKIDVSD